MNADDPTTLKTLVETISDVITVVDHAGTILYESPSIRRVLGHDPDRLVGDSVADYIHPDDLPVAMAAIAAAAREPGSIQSCEIRFRHADGGWRDLEAVGKASPEESEIPGIIVTSRDISARKHAERELRLLATAAEHAREGIMVTDARLDPPGPEILYVNPATTEVTGYASEELTGSTPRVLQGPETDREVLDRLRDRLEKGEVFEGETYNYRKDGSSFLMSWIVAPVRNSRNEITRYVSVQRDVTALREYERTLEREVQARTHDLNRSQEEILDRLARAAEFRDDQTGLHTRRVGEMAATLYRELTDDEERSELVRKAAPLHDVGKIAIPDRILLKPGALTDEEFATMKTHAPIGSRLLSGGGSDLVRLAEAIARSHHERWDGTGYPDGLAKEAIPLEGRVVAVVDTFDALVHERPYKPAWSVERAVEEIRDGAGSRYDPTVVDALVSRLDRLRSLLRSLEGPALSRDAGRGSGTPGSAGP